MTEEYAYILKSFTPEIILIAGALLVLIVDLFLPKKASRTPLLLLGALAFLLAAGMAFSSLLESDSDVPDCAAKQIDKCVRGYASLGMNMRYIPFGYNSISGQEPRMWTWMLPAPSPYKSPAAARAYMLSYQHSRQVIPALPPVDAGGLTNPGWAAMWLFANDHFADGMKVIFGLAGFLVLLLAVPGSRKRGQAPFSQGTSAGGDKASAVDTIGTRENGASPLFPHRAEFVALLLFAAVGLMVMVNGLDLVVIFLGLEVASVCLYALAAWQKGDARSAEAGTKYLLLGSLASGFFIYGASLLYVRFGSTHLQMLAAATSPLTAQGLVDPLALVGLLLLLVGFAFKVAAAPFHLWAPDVYQGAPTPVSAFLSTASKAAGFAVIVRVMSVAFPAMSEKWALLIIVLSGLSMLVGNLVAIHQVNLKRLLAYSGIAQAGYLLVAVAALGLAIVNGNANAHDAAIQAIVLYLFLYMATNIGAFSIVGIMEQHKVGRTLLSDQENDSATGGRTGVSDQDNNSAIGGRTRVSNLPETQQITMADFAGLRWRAPLLAFAMTLLLLSLGGIPLLAGFVGKWFLFLAGVSQGQYVLVILGAITSTVSIYYYLQVVKQMYIIPPPEGSTPVRTGWLAGLALLVIVALVVVIGVYPAPFLDFARWTAESLTMVR